MARACGIGTTTGSCTNRIGGGVEVALIAGSCGCAKIPDAGSSASSCRDEGGAGGMAKGLGCSRCKFCAVPRKLCPSVMYVNVRLTSLTNLLSTVLARSGGGGGGGGGRGGAKDECAEDGFDEKVAIGRPTGPDAPMTGPTFRAAPATLGVGSGIAGVFATSRVESWSGVDGGVGNPRAVDFLRQVK